KTITVTVVHSDGKSEDFVFNTDEDYLGEVLQEAGLISGTPGEFGLYIETVDGETASWAENGAYWAYYVGEEYAPASVHVALITDGAVYKLVYPLGYAPPHAQAGASYRQPGRPDLCRQTGDEPPAQY